MLKILSFCVDFFDYKFNYFVCIGGFGVVIVVVIVVVETQ